jgi:hypothetical protein
MALHGPSGMDGFDPDRQVAVNTESFIIYISHNIAVRQVHTGGSLYFMKLTLYCYSK